MTSEYALHYFNLFIIYSCLIFIAYMMLLYVLQEINMYKNTAETKRATIDKYLGSHKIHKNT